ncbi:NADP-dependent malic enzyme [Halomonas sp. TRM85114]|uniref:NADP-dependent malic enzyme n=1 Tax=Halomonas jincaotanensis TaxID=2810616 RepID=UPI001BD410E4|nr:NADP-dependent malic enzyme [Halomonas jincaotanensis]MBS9403582.1 NADP-dependent malic enzyme [Halomonas jincaotanensis]
MADDLRDSALQYHRFPRPGKLAIQATKPMASQRDLSLAYSPGVAAACEEIERDPLMAAEYTARGNLVAVVSNGTAVLGLGSIGALASKPVMEGKAVLFKKFADVDVFDIEVEERDPDKFIEIVAGLEATFGGINLEDIKAPECFEIERRLRERMDIPVFHDDQHGTAIVTAAALLNGLRVVGKNLGDIRLVCNGAGSAALACLDLAVALGVRKENILVCDRSGVIHTHRDGLDQYKARYAAQTEARTLADAVNGADVFFGLSSGGALKAEMVATMADRPLILAMANPHPEIMPEDAKAVRPDAVIATGRSDYPNQVNNVLCFPFIFRGALDCGATTINEEMKLATVMAIADMATTTVPETVAVAYGGQALTFGPEYILPKPFDPRLIDTIPPAVAKAAMDSGVAARPIEDLDAYTRTLSKLVYRSGNVMEPVFERARQNPLRLLYAEGEDERVLRAMEVCVSQRYAKPVLIGRRAVIEARIEELGLPVTPGVDFELIDSQDYSGYPELASEYHILMGRRGVQPEAAEKRVRSRSTILASMLLRRGDVDAMIAGPVGTYGEHLGLVLDVIGLREGVNTAAALQLLILERATLFIADPFVNYDPDANQIAEITLLAAEQVRRFGITPRAALVSHSSFGSSDFDSAGKMRQALALIRERAPDLVVDGEMQADAALSTGVRGRILPDSLLDGEANLLIMPSLDAANIAFTALKVLGNGVSVGPILLGAAKPVHVLNRSVTARGIANMSAFAVVEAQTDR